MRSFIPACTSFILQWSVLSFFSQSLALKKDFYLVLAFFIVRMEISWFSWEMMLCLQWTKAPRRPSWNLWKSTLSILCMKDGSAMRWAMSEMIITCGNALSKAIWGKWDCFHLTYAIIVMNNPWSLPWRLGRSCCMCSSCTFKLLIWICCQTWNCLSYMNYWCLVWEHCWCSHSQLFKYENMVWVSSSYSFLDENQPYLSEIFKCSTSSFCILSSISMNRSVMSEWQTSESWSWSGYTNMQFLPCHREICEDFFRSSQSIWTGNTRRRCNGNYDITPKIPKADFLSV